MTKQDQKLNGDAVADSEETSGVDPASPASGKEESALLRFCKTNYQLCQWVCFVGILLCYSYYAHLQEVLFGDKTQKLSVSLVLCFQYFIALLVSSIIIVGCAPKDNKQSIGDMLSQSLTWDDLVVAFFGFCSMNFSNKAMSLVSTPFVMLSKSAKVIPVIFVGTLRGVYKPTMKQFIIAIFISLGLIIFNLNKLNKKKDSDESKDNAFGLLLVLGSLAFDGLTQTQTDKQHKASKRDFAYPSMFTNNLFSLVLSTSIYIGEVVYFGDNTHERILAQPQLLFNCVMVGLSGAVGQIFIFLTISLFDCYLLTIITTTRKFFSVVYSNFRFGHNFTEQQWVGAIMVMLCTCAELFKFEDNAMDILFSAVGCSKRKRVDSLEGEDDTQATSAKKSESPSKRERREKIE